MQKLNLSLWSRLILMTIVFYPMIRPALGADLVRILPVTDKILLLVFDEGHIDYAVQENVNVNVYYHPLDVSLGGVYNLSRYSISSATDSDFGSGISPVNVGRKHKPDHVNSKFATPEALMEHSVYIELPNRLEQGHTYTVTVGSLADNLDAYTFAFDVANLRSASIHVNQLGFVPNHPKYAYISQFLGDFDNGQIENGRGEFPAYDGKRFDLIRVSDGASVFNGVARMRKNLVDGGPMTNSVNDGTPFRFLPAGAFEQPQNYNFSEVLEMDFSSFNTPGEYKVVVQDMGSSYPFEIANDAFRDAFSYVLRSLFYQRAGIIQEIEPGREYPRDYHPDDTPSSRYRYYPSWRWIDSTDHRAPGGFTPSGVLPVWGWYHDAGDWDTYPEHGHVPLALNIIYAIRPGNFGDGDIGNRYKLSATAPWIDEGSNGIPDILDEARWLMEYHRRCKNVGLSQGLTTGGVPGGYGGVDGGALDGFPSWQDTRNLNFTAEGPFMTYLYAAEAALYAENMDKLGRTSERDDWQSEAEAAWTWANNNTLPGDNDLWSGNVKKMRHLAALALYVRTKNTAYQVEWKNGLQDDGQYQIAEEGWATPNFWEYGGLLYTSLPASFPGLDVAFQTEVKNVILGMAQTEYLTPHDNRGMRVAFDRRKAHFLGMQSTPMLTTLVSAFNFSGDKTYLDAIHTSAAFFLGGNQEDMCWIVGLGEKSQKFSFHPNSWFVNEDYNSKVYTNEQLPGYVTYGSYQNPDFINNFAADFTGDEDYAKTLLYPTYQYQNWPIMEQHIPNRYAIPGAEFTVSQNLAAAVLTYGFLAGSTSGNYGFNARPTVTLNAPSDIGVGGALLTATTSADTRRVQYYYEEHFIGESMDRTNNFAFFWGPTLPAGTNGVRLTAVAFDDTGLISKPTGGGEKTVNIVPGTFVPVSSVQIDQGPNVVLANVGDELALTATISPSNASNNSVLWSSSDVTIVTVAPSGRVKAVGEGLARVNVTTLDGTKTDVIEIGVGSFVPVTGISVSPPNLSIALTRTSSLIATVTPVNASNKNVTWTSSDPSVATVDANGNVTAIGLGTANITATTVDGSFPATSRVTVTDLNCTGLINASFENGLTGWTLNEGTIITVNDAVDGTSSAQATGQAGMEQQLPQPLAEGTNVVLRFSAKVNATTGWSGVGFDFKDATGATITATNVRITNTNWQEFYLQGDTPANTGRLNVWFFAQSDILNVDNFCLDIESPGPVDNEAPSVPTGLSATAITGTTFTLNWQPSTDNVEVTAYEVFQDGVSIGTSANETKDVTGLTASTAYSMTVRAHDAAGNWSAQSAPLNVTTLSAGGFTTLTVPVANSNDDAEETLSTGVIDLASNDLDIRNTDICAMRFAIDVPQGAVVESASIDFTAKGASSGGNLLTFHGQDVDDAPPFSSSAGDLSSRLLTSASVNWDPPGWADGMVYTSPDLSPIVQEVINRAGWMTRNYLAIQVTANTANKRAARSFDFTGSATDAPRLTVVYRQSSPTNYNQDGGADGLVSMEAEGHTSKASGAGSFSSISWQEINDGTASGSTYMIVPDNGNLNAAGTLDGPRLDFDINFVKTGDHYLWVRQQSPNGSDNSIITAFDGTLLADWNMPEPLTQWTWSRLNAPINVANTGLHTFSVYMREDGTPVDKLLLTTNSTYTPLGEGPPVSGGSSSARITSMIEQLEPSIALQVFPNPSIDGKVTIVGRSLENGTYRIHDPIGKHIQSGAWQGGEKELFLRKGTYFFTLFENGEKLLTRTVIIK